MPRCHHDGFSTGDRLKSPDFGGRLLDEQVLVFKYKVPPVRECPWVIDRTNLGLLRSECLLKVAPNNTWGLGSVDSGPKSLALVVPDHRTSLSVEGSQTLTERVDVIVGPLD